MFTARMPLKQNSVIHHHHYDGGIVANCDKLDTVPENAEETNVNRDTRRYCQDPYMEIEVTQAMAGLSMEDSGRNVLSSPYRQRGTEVAATHGQKLEFQEQRRRSVRCLAMKSKRLGCSEDTDVLEANNYSEDANLESLACRVALGLRVSPTKYKAFQMQPTIKRADKGMYATGCASVMLCTYM